MVMAKPRFIRRASQFTGDDSATARKIAIKSQLIGLRSCQSRYSTIATQTTTSTMRTMSRTAGTKGGIRPAGAASYSMKCFGSAPVPSRPGPVWADSTGPISLTIVGCDP